MSLTIEQSMVEPGLVLIKLKGEVNHHTFEMLEEELTKNIESGVVKLVLDLTQVSYFSSSGLGVLVGAMSQAEMEPGGAFVLFGLTINVKEVFDTMGFSAMFKITEGRPEAVDLAKHVG